MLKTQKLNGFHTTSSQSTFLLTNEYLRCSKKQLVLFFICGKKYRYVFYIITAAIDLLKSLLLIAETVSASPSTENHQRWWIINFPSICSVSSHSNTICPAIELSCFFVSSKVVLSSTFEIDQRRPVTSALMKMIAIEKRKKKKNRH